MRYAACVEYDGTDFHGWQAQKDGCRTVQSEVEKGLSKVADHPVSVVCAGRTDAGVHAYGQVVHFDTDAQRSERSWVLGANTNIPHDVSILWVRPVTDDFNARFSALSRRYRYVIYKRMVRQALLRDRVCWVHRELDVEVMREAAAYLVGEHDFSSFRASGCQAKSPHRNIHFINIEKQHDPFNSDLTSNEIITIEVQANAFLHHMVRNFVGVLMAIGFGDKPPQWTKEVLEAKDRRAGGVTAPAHGLYFMEVEYPQGVIVAP